MLLDPLRLPVHTQMDHARMQPAYVEYLEAENMMLRKQLSQLGVHSEPIKIPFGDAGNVRTQRRRSNAYTAFSRPPRAAKAKTIGADGKTMLDRLEEASRQLAAADVKITEETTVRDVVNLYLQTPVDLRKAVRIHAASKLIPAVAKTNAEKIALANMIKSQLKASLAVTDLEEEQANDVCALLMKAIVHQLDITRTPKHVD